MLAAVAITHKFYTDPFFLNSDIADRGGVNLQEMNFLEEEFLDTIDFNICVDDEEYENYKHSIISSFQQNSVSFLSEVS